MRNRFIIGSLLLILPLGGLAQKRPAVDFDGLPSRPEKLSFPELHYDAPDPARYRVALSNGPIAYVAADRELPLVNIVLLVRTGQYRAPRGKEGLTDLLGYLLTK